MRSKHRSLADLCQSKIETIDPRRTLDLEFWYVDISAVDNTQKRIVSPQHVKAKDASVRARQIIRTGDVLVATTRPNLNAVALVPEQYDGEICSTGFCVLRVGEELDPNYLFCYVQSCAFIEPLVDLTKGALYPAVTDKQVLAQAIPWVSLDEQRSIAAHLNAQLAEVDKARRAAQLQARDIALLRGRLLNEVFKSIGDMPRKVLGNHASTTSGYTPSRGNKGYWESAEIPWVKTGEVAFAPITRTEESISKLALAECSLTLLPPKTVLVAMYGQGKTRGQSAILEVSATTNQACFAILPNDTWEPEFLYYWLVSSYQDLRELSNDRGGNQANLNGALLKALEIPAPERWRQQQIVQRIQAALGEVDALEAASKVMLADLAQLPQRLLAQAFEHHS